MKIGEYIWQSTHWHDWQYHLAASEEHTLVVSCAQGVRLKCLTDVVISLRSEACLAALAQDGTQTGAIEGEALNVASVRSAIVRRLGINSGALAPEDHQMETWLLDGLEGKPTISKWAALAKRSQDTALRDITELLLHDVLQKAAPGGRGTHYEIRPPGRNKMPQAQAET